MIGASILRVAICAGLVGGTGLASAAMAADWPCERVLLDQQARTSVRLSEGGAPASTPTIAAGPSGSLLFVWQQLDGNGVSQLVFRFAEDGCVSPLHRVPETLPGSRLPAAQWTGHDWVIAYEAQLIPEPLIRRVRVAHGSGDTSPPRTVSNDGAVGARIRLVRSGDDVLYVWSEASRLESALEATEPTTDDDALRRLPVHDFASGGVALRHEIVARDDGTLHLLVTDRPKVGRSSNTGRIVALTRSPDGDFGEPVALTTFKRERSDQASPLIDPEQPDAVRIAWVQQNQRKPDHFELHTALWRTTQTDPPLEDVRIAPIGSGEVHQPLLTASRVIWRTGLPGSGPLFTLPQTSIGEADQRAELLFGGRAIAQVQAFEDEGGTVHLVFYDPALRQTHYGRLGP